MKKILFLISILFFVISCSDSPKTENSTSDRGDGGSVDSLQTCTFGLDSAEFAQNEEYSRGARVDRRPPKGTGGGGGGDRTPVLFLDFDGAVVTGTSWNWAGPIICNGSGMDSLAMQEVFDKAVAAYAPWNVVITTDSTVFEAAPNNRRQKIIITTSHEWYGTNAGGIAYVGSYGVNNANPCFVFTALLGLNTKYIKEATCHELGHTLGMLHQSTWTGIPGTSSFIKTSEYNFGGNGFAPIMGCAYYQPTSWWITGYDSNGEIQRDSSIIGSKFTLR